jgi:hypothetical protein
VCYLPFANRPEEAACSSPPNLKLVQGSAEAHHVRIPSTAILRRGQVKVS